MQFINQTAIRGYKFHKSINKITFFLFLIFFSFQVCSIVPVDSPVEFPDGWSGVIGVTLNGHSGNKDKSDYGISNIFRYSKDDNLFLFITGYDYAESNDIVNQDELYLHSRWVNLGFFKENIDSEVFIQHEYDEFADISGRTLLGGGVRYRLKDFSDDSKYEWIIGTGAFYEKEKSIKNDLTVDLVRANFYGKYVYQNKGDYPYKAFATVYIQPGISDIEDYRALAIGGFEFSVSENFKVILETEIQHNSTPFENIKKTDFEYGVRLAYKF